ncbi:MAG TPA: zinc ribbon domain-containing protein [Streptosporangiaceae bacterium]|nr:zinc ribbon domain-containing protein [Streptosporangiaceae bacterium]
MPRYEYRCRACGATFERNRPMAEASAPAPCPQGHDDTVKLLSTVAVGGRAGSTAGREPADGGGRREAPGWGKQSGGCCGGACGCR